MYKVFHGCPGIAQSVELWPMEQKVLGSSPGSADSAYEQHIVREVLGVEDRCGALSSANHLPVVKCIIGNWPIPTTSSSPIKDYSLTVFHSKNNIHFQQCFTVIFCPSLTVFTVNRPTTHIFYNVRSNILFYKQNTVKSKVLVVLETSLY